MFLGSGGRNKSNSHKIARFNVKKIFDELDEHLVQKVGIKRFWSQEAKMSLTAITSLESARRKLFHELDVHHVQKAGIKRFWAQEAEMSLIANSSIESATRKFFMNSTYIMSRKEESNVFCQNQLRRPKFFKLDVHHIQKVGIKRFWSQEAKMSPIANGSLESARRNFS